MSIVVIANGFVDVAHFLVQRRRRWNTLCFAFACANKGKKQRERGKWGQETEGQIKQGQEAERVGQTGAKNRRLDQTRATVVRDKEKGVNGQGEKKDGASRGKMEGVGKINIQLVKLKANQ